MAKEPGGVLVASQAATCNSRTYDYFVISKGLLRVVGGVQREDNGASPSTGRPVSFSEAMRPASLWHGPLPRSAGRYQAPLSARQFY